ncbi:hypothetical protein [uncultured Roseibium sp.]|uniref:hypothetical protein n=1 Tax=uncultured Roseibium sp. TaxID=1936171 RepID=UPI00374D5CF2
MHRSGIFSIGRMIARALTLAALIVMACGPSLAGTRSLENAGTASLVQNMPSSGALHQALADAQKNHSDKTASSRCKGRNCLQPALHAAFLPDTNGPIAQAPAREHDNKAVSGVTVRVASPPPKNAVS